MFKPMKSLAVALALALGGAALAQAPEADQEQLREELREAKRQLAEVGRRVAELSVQLGDDAARVQMFRHLGNPDRAVIGVLLGDSGKDGVAVQGVTPGGPADKAGLRAGDTIVSLRGSSLAGDEPHLALRDALKDLKAGDKVALTYRRDGREQSAELTAERQGSVAFLGGPGARTFVFDSDKFDGDWTEMPGIERRVESIVEHALGDGKGAHFNVMSMIGMGGLRLSSLNPGLARYFGVSKGALVLEVDKDQYQGLEAGDVILEVDGKPVEDPRDAMRELAKQDPGRPVQLKLQRERVTQLVDARVPEKARAFLLPPAPPAPPVPPPPGQHSMRHAPQAIPQPRANTI